MTVADLIPLLLHCDIGVRLLAVELVRTSGNRAVIKCVVNELVKRLSIQNAQRRLYAAEALVCMGGLAVNQLTYRLLRSRSSSLQIKLAEILGAMLGFVEGEHRVQIFQDLHIAAHRTRNSAVALGCMDAMARIRRPIQSNHGQKKTADLTNSCSIRPTEPSAASTPIS